MRPIVAILVWMTVAGVIAYGAFLVWGYYAEQWFVPEQVYDANGTLIEGDALLYDGSYVAETNSKRQKAFLFVFWGLLAIVLLVMLYVLTLMIDVIRHKKSLFAQESLRTHLH